MLFHGGEAYIRTHFLVMKMQAVYWVRTRHFWRKVWLQLTLGSACVPIDTTPNMRVYHQLPLHFLCNFFYVFNFVPSARKAITIFNVCFTYVFFPHLWHQAFCGCTHLSLKFIDIFMKNIYVTNQHLIPIFQSWFPVSIDEFKQHYIMQFRKISWWIWPNGQFPCDYILNLWRGHSYTSNCVHKL